MKQNKRKREAAETAVAVEADDPVPTLAVPVQTPAYKLAASCTVRDSASLKTALNDLVRVKGEAILDVSAIERIDTAVVQLLYAFVRDRKAQGDKVVWVGNSECFTDAVKLLGLATHLDVPQASGAL
jgi:anti-anti-sigma regulatory factor